MHVYHLTLSGGSFRVERPLACARSLSDETMCSPGSKLWTMYGALAWRIYLVGVMVLGMCVVLDKLIAYEVAVSIRCVKRSNVISMSGTVSDATL